MGSYDLSRFLKAQRGAYESALREITNGQKAGHWMWYILPQIDGLGLSAMSRKYGLAGVG